MRVKVSVTTMLSGLFALLLSAAVTLAGGAILYAYVENSAYPAYLSTLDLGEGSVGSAPLEDTPRVSSLSDISRYEKFAPVVLHYRASQRIDGRQYYELTFPGGEVVIGHLTGADITPAGTTEDGQPLYQLPISRWEPVTPSRDGESFSAAAYDDVTHYIECQADVALTQGQYFVQHPAVKFLEMLMIAVLIGAYIFFLLYFRRRKKAKEAARGNQQ